MKEDYKNTIFKVDIENPDNIATRLKDEYPSYNPQAIIKCGHAVLCVEKRFNWLNRFMFKFFFGLEIQNLK